MKNLFIITLCFVLLVLAAPLSHSADSGIISGLVTVESGMQSMIGARVYLYNIHREIEDSSITSYDGRFQFDLMAGEYYVSAEKDNFIREYYPSAYRISDANRVVVYPGQNVSLAFNLDRGGWLGGSFDYSGTGVEKALVTAIKINEPYGGWHRSEMISGNFPLNYVLNGLIPGAYKVMGMATGKRTEFYPGVHNIEDADIIYITRNSGAAGISFMLEPAGSGSISGTVYDINTGDLLSGMPIFAYQWAEYWIDPNLHTTYTDSNGEFEFNLSEGDYYFYLNCDDCMPGSGRVSYYFENQYNPLLADIVTVLPGGNLTGVDFAVDFSLSHGLSISGNITDVNTGGGLRDVVVTAFEYGSCIAINSTYSSDNGNFILDNLPSNEYFLMFSGNNIIPYFFRSTFSWENSEIIILNSDCSNIQTEAITQDYGQLGLAISGTVVVPGGPVSGARVYAYRVGEESPAAFGVSSASGDYSITTGLMPGLYTVVCDLFGYQMEVYPFEISLDLQSNPTAEDIDFLLQPVLTYAADNLNLPDGMKILDNYPNPFNSETRIRIYMSSGSEVRTEISVYNILGREVGSKNVVLNSGVNVIEWNANDFDRQLSSGIYFYKIGGINETRKMIFLK